jgi:hypothetical protein
MYAVGFPMSGRGDGRHTVVPFIFKSNEINHDNR